MYIHIGENHMIRASDIIAILDKDSARASELANEYLNASGSIDLSKGALKSVVITSNNVYLSPLASGTLNRRSSKKGIFGDLHRP